MALRHDYTIICEFARLELGGKWSLIGVFPNGIGTSQIPLAMPMLTFFQVFTPDSLGTYTLEAQLSHLTEPGPPLVAGAKVQIQVALMAPVIIPIGMPNIQFRAPGPYAWSVRISGQDEPIVTTFQVTHAPMQFRQMPPPGS